MPDATDGSLGLLRRELDDDAMRVRRISSVDSEAPWSTPRSGNNEMAQNACVADAVFGPSALRRRERSTVGHALRFLQLIDTYREDDRVAHGLDEADR